MNGGIRIRSMVGAVGLLALATAVPALAHHSFAVFDHANRDHQRAQSEHFSGPIRTASSTWMCPTARATSSRSPSS